MTLSRRSIALIVAVILVAFVAVVALYARPVVERRRNSPQGIELREAQAFQAARPRGRLLCLTRHAVGQLSATSAGSEELTGLTARSTRDRREV